MRAEGVNALRLAQHWGLPASTVTRALNRSPGSLPSSDMLMRFHAASNGLIGLEDWRRFVKWRDKRATPVIGDKPT